MPLGAGVPLGSAVLVVPVLLASGTPVDTVLLGPSRPVDTVPQESAVLTVTTWVLVIDAGIMLVEVVRMTVVDVVVAGFVLYDVTVENSVEILVVVDVVVVGILTVG